MIMDREEIFKRGTEYANKHWSVLDNPNEHDNAREDFINGAMEAVKNCSMPDVVGQREQLVCDECGDTGRSYPTLQYPDGVDCEKCKAN